MCPDNQLLSVYFDGEMPSPWKEKLETHIAKCPLCAKKLEKYKLLSAKLGAEEEAEIIAAKERVWQKINQNSGETKLRLVPRNTEGLWQRRISIPIPAAAAAAALIIAALAFMMVIRGPVQTNQTESTNFIAADNEFEIPGIIPATDMESVLQYLSARDGGDVLIFLPENRSFVNYSEPLIVTAADYSRQTSGRTAGRRP